VRDKVAASKRKGIWASYSGYCGLDELQR